jgi:tRNA A37 methylthiotransferase MiaB
MTVRKKRAGQLRELSLHRYQSEALKQVGLKKKVLVLNNEARGAQGLSRDYWPVKWDLTVDWKAQSGQEVEIQIANYQQTENWQDGLLMGTLV